MKTLVIHQELLTFNIKIVTNRLNKALKDREWYEDEIKGKHQRTFIVPLLGRDSKLQSELAAIINRIEKYKDLLGVLALKENL